MNNTAADSKFGKIFISLVCLIIVTVGIIIWQTRLPRIAVANPTFAQAIQAVVATGVVEAREFYPLAPRISGHITHLLVEEGSMVKAGQVLAKLESAELREQVSLYLAQSKLAEQTYLRSKSLQQSGSISQQDFDKAYAEWKVSQANVAKAQAQLNFSDIVAKKAGRIIRRDAEIGQLAIANQNIFWVASDSRLRVSAQIDEEDITLIKVGQKALITNSAFPKQIFTGELAHITPLGDSSSRSFRVRINLPDDIDLRLGMTAEINIPTRITKNASFVPVTALDNNQIWLWDDKQQIFQAVNVQKGITSAKNSEIISPPLPANAIIAESAILAKKYQGKAQAK